MLRIISIRSLVIALCVVISTFQVRRFVRNHNTLKPPSEDWWVRNYIRGDDYTKDTVKTFYRASDITFGLNILDDVFSHWLNNRAPVCEGGYRCRYAEKVEDADGVIFQPSNIHEIRFIDFVNKRKFRQRWIFFSWESTINSVLPPVWRHQFNWTASYMHRSDIYTPYGGGFRPFGKGSKTPPKVPSLREKKKFAFAVYSNCHAKDRNEAIRELKKYIPIDIYGLCGRGRIPHGYWNVVELSRSYKFYLSFENSQCRDYLSEKYWKNSLQGFSVPVILGGYERSDVERVAPPHSFIYFRDFKTVQDLANFLILLSKDEKRYEKYLEWKQKYEVITTPHAFIALCAMCRRLHTDFKPSIRDIDVEWNSKLLCRPSSVRTVFNKTYHQKFGP